MVLDKAEGKFLVLLYCAAVLCFSQYCRPDLCQKKLNLLTLVKSRLKVPYVMAVQCTP